MSEVVEQRIKSAGCEDATSLDLSFCYLREVPEVVGRLVNLTTLNLSGNGLQALPSWLGELNNLTALNLSGNGLRLLPDWLGQSVQLTNLNLSGNGLEALPGWIGELIKLTSLNLSVNGLQTLPDELSKLTSLATLNLGHNKIRTLPDWFGRLANLANLNLSVNDLLTLPDWLYRLTNIATLSLDGNRLRILPDVVSQLTNLTTLNLSSNGMEALPDWLGRLTNLTTLNLDGNALEVLPDAVGKLVNLEALNLDSNRVRTLPDAVGRLVNLTTLNLDGNALEALPGAVSRLVNLRALSLNGNRIRVLPDWLARLANLTILNLSVNGLRALPDAVGQLVNLVTLNLDGNRLRALPDAIGQLANLNTLSLSSNGLAVFPDAVGQLTNLTTLNLGHNDLEALPDWLGRSTSLTTLDLRGNAGLISPPPEVVAGGTQAVLAFLRAGQDAGTTRLWRSKLILVGQGRAGKTTLVAALDGRGFDPTLESTQGLAVTTLLLPHPNPQHNLVAEGATMNLAVWDFGGQEIYHSTHQFFLTARSLFLVVWDPNQGYDNSRLRYWLDTVTARAPGAPILLVATHGAQRPADLPLTDLLARYPDIIGVHTVDSSTGEGIDELRDAIAAHAAALPLMGAPWPASWAAAADALRALSDTHTTVADASSLFTDHHVDTTQHDELLSALTFLGDILHYPDDPLLSDMVVLQPQWLNTRIARILDSKQVAGRNGQLRWDDVNTEWSDIEPGLREHFLTMMDRYDISYRVHDQGVAVASIVTALLPWNRPDLTAHWLETYMGQHTELSYHLSFIPPGIPTWFITRTRRFALEHWRTGALLRDPDSDTHALVQADPDTGTLHLAARGAALRRFLPVLLSELEHSLGRYPGLHADRFVDCPLSTTHQHTAHQYRYVSLLKALLRDDVTVTCPDTGDELEIVPLLAGINPTPVELVGLGTTAQLERLEAKLGGIHFERIARDIATTRENTEALRVSAQEAAGTRCPRVFTVRRIRRGPLRSRYELRVCCEYEQGWHEIGSGASGARDAVYDLRTLRAWARTITPVIQVATATAHAATPLISLLLVGTSVHLHGKAKREVLTARSHLPKLPAHLALPDQLRAPDDLPEAREPTAYAHTDADYRELHALFAALDAGRPGLRPWGGLSAVQDSNGRTIFLCSQHASIHY